MSPKLQLRVIVTVLFVLGLGFAAYKNLLLGFPLNPGEQEQVWTVQAQVQMRTTGEPTRVKLNMPDMTKSLYVVDQGSAPRGFGFHVETSGTDRLGVWESRGPMGDVRLIYSARIYKGGGLPPKRPEPEGLPVPPTFDSVGADAADELLEEAYRYSADAVGFALRLSDTIMHAKEDANVRTLLGEVSTNKLRAEMIVSLLRAAEIPAHTLRGFTLGQSKRAMDLETLVELWDGDNWVVIDPRTRVAGMPAQFLPWQSGDEFLYEVEGARNSKLSFSVIEDQISARSLAIQSARNNGSSALYLSVFSLPVDVQNTFAVLLLIPIGALVVVVLRNLVGLQTSGTFMPILIALVFTQTELITGLMLFVTIVGVGLVIRGYLSSLNLLLVPRIAAVLIVVICLYLAMSVIGFRLGLEAALSVTFFPMIIIAWTIERMSVLAEEEGMRDVLMQGGGSLFTAVIAYLVMTNNQVAYLTFAFPELLLVVLAVILMIGQYTGFRLSELRRFEPLSGVK